MSHRPHPFRHLAAPLTALVALAPLAPVRAIERIELQLPLLETSFTVNVSELRNRQALLSGNSDLAELDQASGGAIGRRLVTLLEDPLPLSSRVFADKTVGSPLGNQALLLVSALVRIDGMDEGESTQLRQGLERLDRTAEKGSLTVLDVLEAIPGKTATIDIKKN